MTWFNNSGGLYGRHGRRYILTFKNVLTENPVKQSTSRDDAGGGASSGSTTHTARTDTTRRETNKRLIRRRTPIDPTKRHERLAMGYLLKVVQDQINLRQYADQFVNLCIDNPFIAVLISLFP